MSPHEQGPYHDGRVLIGPAFKADAPARHARLRALGPIHPAEFHHGLNGWAIVGYDLARQALTHPAGIIRGVLSLPVRHRVGGGG
ncbi:hypothetical protein [Streptomyces sp. NPDC051286]|uniref:hypothetical protein n=1 Tax=Streptomyces sp. NPDC051286 TaxID=3365647 RepID=UPI00378C0A57